MTPRDRDALDIFPHSEQAVEVGIGDRHDLALRLAERGIRVIAMDLTPRSVPPEVSFIRDDVTDPQRHPYTGTDLVYARRLPPELHRPVRTFAAQLGAACYFTTLGYEQPAVPAEPITAGNTTWFRVRCRSNDR